MIKYFYNWWYQKFPPEMVKWWMEKEAVKAKVTEAEDGSYIMWMEGEKYPFPGYPRGHLLYGSLSPLKHQIKNQIFNESWELKDDPMAVTNHVLTKASPNILKLGYESRHDMMPFERMCPAVKEIHRALTVAGVPKGWVDIITFIFQEDDAYRFRFQWLAPHAKKKGFFKAMELLEHAEVVDDMKGRVRLVRTILDIMQYHKDFREPFRRFLKELNIKKVRLSKADKYYFRAKYFKVDYPNYEY